MRNKVSNIIVLGMILFLYNITVDYFVDGDKTKEDTRTLYEIYDELPVPEFASEIGKKKIIRKRYCISLVIDYSTELNSAQVGEFYIENLSKKGWIQIKDKGGNGIAFKRGEWEIYIHKEKEKYNLDICKYYRE